MLSKQAFNGLLKTLKNLTKFKIYNGYNRSKKNTNYNTFEMPKFDLKELIKKSFKTLKKYIFKEVGTLVNRIKDFSFCVRGFYENGISLLDKALILQSVNEKKQIDDEMVSRCLDLLIKQKLLNYLKKF